MSALANPANGFRLHLSFAASRAYAHKGKGGYGENIQPDISMRLYLFKSLKLKRLNETTRHKSPTLLDENHN